MEEGAEGSGQVEAEQVAPVPIRDQSLSLDSVHVPGLSKLWCGGA